MENVIEQAQKKAEVLIEALPYMQKLSGTTVVIKYGGKAMINAELKSSVMDDIILLKCIGMNPIIVHGGGPDITATLQRLGIESRFVDGLRVTDEKTMEVVQMVLVGKTNKEIVAMLNQKGAKAIGLCGIDGGMLGCEPLALGSEAAPLGSEAALLNSEAAPLGSEAALLNSEAAPLGLGFVGDVTRVDCGALDLIAKDAYIPVVAPIGVGKDGHSFNINADTAAARIAAALKAEKLILLTDVDGIKGNPGKNGGSDSLGSHSDPCSNSSNSSSDSPDSPDSPNGLDGEAPIPVLTSDEVHSLIRSGVISKGMIPKALGCLEALEAGVGRTHIIDGRMPHCILLEIFTNKGIGTMILKEKIPYYDAERI